MRGGGNDRATGSMAGKVMASRSVSTVVGTGYGMAPLTSRSNPSTSNGNSPPREPTVHGLLGPSQMGPYMPGPKLTAD